MVDTGDEAVAVFTFHSKDEVLRVGGSRWWKLSKIRAKEAPHLVCVRNAFHENSVREEPHGFAFLVCGVSSVELTPEDPDRYIIRFHEWAEVNVPNVWQGWRFPVRYMTPANDVRGRKQCPGGAHQGSRFGENQREALRRHSLQARLGTPRFCTR